MKFKRQKIGLAVYLAIVALTASTISTFFLYNKFTEITLDETRQKVAATRDVNKHLVESAYSRIIATALSTAAKNDTANAIREFEEALYLSPPNTLPAYSLYAQVYAKRHLELMQIARAHNLDDVLLIEPTKGLVIYSGNSNMLGASTVNGNQLDPAISKAVSAILEQQLPQSSLPLEKTEGGAVIAVPIKDNAQTLGVLVFIVADEMFADSMALTSMWRDLDVTVNITNDKGITDDGIERQEGKDGERIIVAFSPLAISGFSLAITAYTSEKMAFASFDKIKEIVFLALISAIVIATLIFFLISKNLFAPLEKLGNAIGAVASSGIPLEQPLNVDDAKWAQTLFDRFNDMNLRLGDTMQEARSSYEALAKYIDNLEESMEKREENTGDTEKSRDDKNFLKTIQRLEQEMARLRIELKKSKKNLATADNMRERVLAMASPETKNRLATAVRIAESLSANAQKETEGAMGALLAELYGFEKTIDRALAGFIDSKCFDTSSLKEASLSALAEEAVKSLTSLAQKRNVRMSFKPSTESDIANVNRDLIRIAMVKLVENAIMFAPPKGSVEAQVKGTESMIRFEVKDTGEGVEKWKIQKMFNQFHTGENDNYEETGLFACRVIIKNHDGRIGAESEPGKGTLFFFELPKGQAPVQETLAL